MYYVGTAPVVFVWGLLYMCGGMGNAITLSSYYVESLQTEIFLFCIFLNHK